MDTRHCKSLGLLESWINRCERREYGGGQGCARLAKGGRVAVIYGVPVVGHVIESSGSHSTGMQHLFVAISPNHIYRHQLRV